MSLIKRIVGRNDQNFAQSRSNASKASLEDEALDTLGCVIRVTGDESFPLDDEVDATEFTTHCIEFAKHVENGSAVPHAGIPEATAGQRAWPKVRGFLVDRRKAEKAFVSTALQNYRLVVDDLISGFKQIGQRDKDAEASIRSSLGSVESAVDVGSLSEIKAVLNQTISQINETFARQKQEYEQQISDLQEKMSSLRQDLVSTVEQMKRDPLTEVYNRAAFDSAIQYSLNMRFIANQPGTLVLIDVDHFKEVNDSYGHSAGDDVLRSIATCLQRSFIRKSDLVSRIGGDEFAVILNDTSGGNSEKLIRRFQDLIAEINVPYAPADVRVGCSIGYTEIAANDSAQTLVERADKALYQAKNDGRNCMRAVDMPVETDAVTPPAASAETAKQVPA